MQATSLAMFAIFAYGLNGAAYLNRLGETFHGTWAVLFGSFLVIFGYLLMTVAKTNDVMIANHTFAQPRVDHTEKVGSSFLALFFLSSLFLGTNITLQYYDPLAAAGYIALFVSMWSPTATFPAAIMLGSYYLFGAIHKIGSSGITNSTQFIGRISLLIYYVCVAYAIRTQSKHSLHVERLQKKYK